ncbi:MAG: serine/threonine protein kinase [Verrucomicrobia bacterium]|nr:serine/threonine protein kinase [Verrucomicrobiota bacterium]
MHLVSVFALLLVLISTQILAADWTQFRGPGGSGISDSKGAPLKWSDTEGLAWKIDLPGPGTSSPIVFGNKIFLTCYTGVQPGRGASLDDLKRHLLCLDRATGKLLWNTPVPADLPEQSGIREDHGYATSTPVADAERVYVFWGKSGVFAFDHAGKKLWNTKVGTQLNGWGSATSPVLHKDLVLVNASVESSSLVALDKKTGTQKWSASGITESWHAPLVVALPGGKSEVVAACIKQVFGFDADTGAPLWTCQTGIGWYMCPTPVAKDGIIYAIGGRNPQNGLAIKAGGRGEVSGSHVLWKINKGSNVPSPVLHDGHLFWAHENLGVIYCASAKTGEIFYEERLNPNPGQIYASPVLADGKLYYVGRQGCVVIAAASPRFEVLADNTLENNRGVFNATPAFDGSRLLLRSNRSLYAIGK